MISVGIIGNKLVCSSPDPNGVKMPILTYVDFLERNRRDIKSFPEDHPYDSQ